MKKLICLSIVALVFLSARIHAEQHEHSAAGVKPGCNINAGSCIEKTESENIRAIFDINPKPVKPMTELFFRVTLQEGKKPVTDAAVNLDLTMPGMFMGINRPVLKHVEDGRYEGKGILPVCPHGGNKWEADIEIIRNGKKFFVSYVFEVQ